MNEKRGFDWAVLGLVALGLGACAVDSAQTEASKDESAAPAEEDALLHPPMLDGGATPPPPAYPAAPYGFRAGAVVPNVAFVGWRDPLAVEQAPEALEVIRLGDFYDPDGAKGIKLILVNSSAKWCNPCNQEYNHLRDANVYAKYRPLGVVFLGTLAEGAVQGEPATFATITGWAKQKKVNFPFALDAQSRLNDFAPGSGIPFNFLIDAKTMRYVSTIGFDGGDAIEKALDRELAKRP